MLQAARAGGYALGGFNVYNLEGVRALVATAEAERSPVLLQIHPAALDHGGRNPLSVVYCSGIRKST
jgi:tagatose 1,6-diphosphate aldolase GatY/KbaY